MSVIGAKISGLLVQAGAPLSKGLLETETLPTALDKHNATVGLLDEKASNPHSTHQYFHCPQPSKQSPGAERVADQITPFNSGDENLTNKEGIRLYPMTNVSLRKE